MIVGAQAPRAGGRFGMVGRPAHLPACQTGRPRAMFGGAAEVAARTQAYPLTTAWMERVVELESAAHSWDRTQEADA